jgi:hypothetical protein
MKPVSTFKSGFSLLILSMFLISTTVSAQDAKDASNYHPFLSDKIYMNLGVFVPNNETSLGLGIGGEPSDSISGSEEHSTASLALRWRFTENWSVWGQYWSTDSSSTGTVNNDVTYPTDPPITVKTGSNITLETELDIFRLFFGRSFFKKPQSEWGAGLGLHWMQFGLGLTADLDTDPPTDYNGTHGGSVKAGVPLPNLGVWYMYSWSPKWVTTVRLDWLDVDIGDVSGNLYDLSAGVNWQFSKHVGVGLAYQVFNFGADYKDGPNKIKLELEQTGPFLALSANW